MTPLQPQGLNRRRVEQLLSKAKNEHSIASRVDFFSRQFLGCSYKANPLIGSADTAEVFTASLDEFDCVTYIETTLALSRASNVDDFVKSLRTIRYERSRIRWERRNHYMTAWIRNNVREGIIKPVSMSAVPTVTRERILNVVPGLAPRRVRIRCVSKTSAARLEAHLQTGDLIFFASTRKNLDVFHAGITVREGENVLIRHASRGQGVAVEQTLEEFLKHNRMAGIMAVQPREITRRSRANK